MVHGLNTNYKTLNNALQKQMFKNNYRMIKTLKGDKEYPFSN